MNSIKDFTRLRPDVEAPTTDELDAIWARACGRGAAGIGDPSPHPGGVVDIGRPREDRRSRRRLAVAGAAASIVIGIAALAFFTETRTADDEAAEPPVQPTAPVTSPATSPPSSEPVISTTVPGETIPLTDLEVAAESLRVEVALDAWTVDAEESVNVEGTPGGQWHYRSPSGQQLDIALYPGGEERFRERLSVDGDLVQVGDHVQISRLAGPGVETASYRLTALLALADGEFTIEIDLDQVADEQLFYDIVATVGVFDEASGERLAIGDLVDGAIPAMPPAPGPASTAAVVIGDLVALGAFEELQEIDIVVDAVASRTFAGGVDVIDAAVDRGLVGSAESSTDTVVVHLGSNGSIAHSDLTATLDALSDVPKVVLVTSALDRDWVPANNALLADAADDQANVDLLDWAALAVECPGDCFHEDQVHLTSAGAEYYASAIRDAVGR